MIWSWPMTLLGVVAALCAALWFVGWRRRHARAAHPYLALTTILLVWTLAYMWELGTSSFTGMLLAARIQYLVIPLVPVATLGLALTYAGHWVWKRHDHLLVLLIVPVVTTVLAWTNPHHQLIWRTIHVRYGSGWSLLQVTYGPFFWVYVAYSYLLLLGALALVVGSGARREGMWRRQSFLIALGTAAPFAGNILHVFHISLLGPLDPTVFLFAISCLTLGLAALNPRFLLLAPVDRDVILDIISDGVLASDGEGFVTDLNASAERILGVAARAGVGQALPDVLGPFRSQLDVPPGKATTHTVEVDGVERVYVCTRSPLNDGAPIPMGWAFVFHDLTEQARAHRELRRARDELEFRVAERTRSLTWANEMLNEEIRRRGEAQEHERTLMSQLLHAQKLETIGTLAGGIAHDFNNLLAVIIGYTDIAMADAPEDGPLRDDLAQILGAADQAKALARRILSFAKPGEQIRAPVDLGESASQVVALMQAVTPGTVEISTSIDPETPRVTGDATQIQQVLMNLCSNAAQAMDDGGSIVVEVGPSDGGAALRVRDTGKGMDRETISRIFEPFFTTKDSTAGTGLGLAVVHDIVEGHGGEITVESEVGVGSSFTVVLPGTGDAAKGAEDGEARKTPQAGPEDGWPGTGDGLGSWGTLEITL